MNPPSPAKAVKTVKTRFCLISDTHTQPPIPLSSTVSTTSAYRSPLPRCDVLLHAGDLTEYGTRHEFETAFQTLADAPAELKIVIAGNHDVSLDREWFEDAVGRERVAGGGKREDVQGYLRGVREMWMGEEARAKGIWYLEEGAREFEVGNGGRFKIYTSPYTPAYMDWAFAYDRNTDRYNPPSASPTPHTTYKPPSPIPSFPAIDILLTHGPPRGTLDGCLAGPVGCDNLFTALQRCRPRLHVFGHIHESWGAVRWDWGCGEAEKIQVGEGEGRKGEGVKVDISEEGGKALRFGEETLFVNAAVMNHAYRPENAPWVVDLDLPVGGR